MKANELMIGDWVKSRGKIEQVREVYNGFICTDSFKDSHDYHFDPIPLTPEILRKNGFTFDVLPFIQSWEQFGIMLYRGGNGYRINCGQNVTMKIDAVHNLQHVLRLCGIEKEIIV